MEHVLLIGIGGVYNYGCEAIVRGTVEILRKVNPQMQIAYASYNYEDDKRRLKDCDVKIIPRSHVKKWSLANIIRKSLSYVGIHYSLPFDKTDWLDGFDAAFSIGGDMYTLSSQNGFDTSLPTFLHKCQTKGLKYILWGASVGKFEKNPKALKFFSKHLPKIDLIVARENNTIEYLHSLGVGENCELAPDPAFFVKNPAKKISSHTGTVVGINLSPLSALYEYADLEVAVQRQSEALARLMDAMQCQLLLLPHVLSPHMNDNDLSYMRLIYAKMPREYQSKIQIVESDPGFVGIKNFICQCDFVIAARMHCAINAITMSVPTLFLSYSEKAKGMAEFVYGTKEAVIGLTEFENTIAVANKLKNWKYTSRLDKIQKFDFTKILK